MRTNNFIPLLFAIFLHFLVFLSLTNSPPKELEQESMLKNKKVYQFNLASLTKQNHSSPSLKQTAATSNKTVGTSKSIAEHFTSQNSETIANDEKTDSFTSLLLKYTLPNYPLLARKKGWEGKVKLRVFYNEAGKVTNTQILESSGYPILDQSALTCVNQWEIRKNQPGSFEKTFEFKLNN